MFRNRKVKCYIMIAALMVMLFSLALPAAARPLEVEADRLNVRSGPGTGNKVLSLVTRGTVLKPVQEKDDWVQVILPSGDHGWVAGWYTAPYSPQRYATVNVTGLNVRSGPGTAYRVIDLLAANTSVPVLREENDWFNVLLPDGRHGWLAGWYTATAQFKGYVVVKGSLNFRSGPGTGHKIRGKLAKGDLLAVIGVSSSGNWLRVVAENGSTGWVSKSYTKPLDGKNAVNQPASALSGKTVVLDPGHGGADPGAVGVTGYREKIVNLAVARELAALLGQAGAKVIMTRTGDLNPTLWQRVNLANTGNASVFVSIHSNAHPQSWVSGTETYYYPWNASSSRSRILATHLQQQLVGALGLRDIGVKTASFYVITYTNMPSALVELAFLSNYGDEALLRQPQTHKKSAEALFRGLEAFFR